MKTKIIMLFVILVVIVDLFLVAIYGNTPAADVPLWVWLFIGRK